MNNIDFLKNFVDIITKLSVLIFFFLIHKKNKIKEKYLIIPLSLIGLQVIMKLTTTLSQTSFACGNGKKYYFCDFSFFSSYQDSSINWFLETIPIFSILIIILYFKYKGKNLL